MFEPKAIGLLSRYVKEYIWHLLLRRSVQVFEGTPGIDVKKVRSQILEEFKAKIWPDQSGVYRSQP